MINQRYISSKRATFGFGSALRLVLFCSTMLSVATASASPTPIQIDYEDKDGQLGFSIVGQAGVISRDQLQFSLSDDRKTLLKIEIESASIEKSKYWIKSFSESKSDPDIKGIMVRKDQNKDLIQIRVRYKSRISHNKKNQIKLVEIPNGVKVVAPRSFGNQVVKEEVSLTPKPSLDPKLSKISSLSSSLADDQTQPNNNPERPSVFDKGTPTAPLPAVDRLRTTGLVNQVPNQLSPHPSGATVTPSIPKPMMADSVSTIALASSGIPAPLPTQSPLKSLDQDKMYSLNTPKAPLESKNLPQSGSQTDNMNLDELSTLASYTVLFLLLLWAASYFFKRGKSLDIGDSNAIKVISEKVVGISPRQRLMVVETMGHTFVVGACERGGLSQIAHISTPNGPVGGSLMNFQQAHNPGASVSSLDALGQFARDDQYYRTDSYPLDDTSYQRSESVSVEASVAYEENTFVGEDEAFTAEVPSVQHHQALDPMNQADSYHNSARLEPNELYPADNMGVGSDSVGGANSQAEGFDLGEEEDVNMKPGDLLQWIQKLNGTKG